MHFSSVRSFIHSFILISPHIWDLLFGFLSFFLFKKGSHFFSFFCQILICRCASIRSPRGPINDIRIVRAEIQNQFGDLGSIDEGDASIWDYFPKRISASKKSFSIKSSHAILSLLLFQLTWQARHRSDRIESRKPQRKNKQILTVLLPDFHSFRIEPFATFFHKRSGDVGHHGAGHDGVASDAGLWAVECGCVFRETEQSVLGCCICGT